MARKPATSGAHHVGLTVPDLAATRNFFIDTLAFWQVGEVRDYPAVFVTDGTTMITLWQAEDPATAVAFDRKKVIGLHHLALKVDGSEALRTLEQTLLETPGVTIEFAPEPLGEGGTQHLMCAIPSGIRVEFIAPAG